MLPWKTLCVFHELPQGLSNQITHEKPRKAPKWRSETRIDPLKLVSVPELIRTTEVESALASAFDRLRHEPLQSWAGADTDPVRREIDDAVAQAYGISAGVLADWRERLANEPTIANQSPL